MVETWRSEKGADTSINGIHYFRDLDREEVHTMLLNVKGGDNVGPSMFKDLLCA